jgi:hypothetical protein
MKVAYSADNFAKIFNSDAFSRSREIRLCNIRPESQRLAQPGEYTCFDMEVSFGKEKFASGEEAAGRVQRGELSCSFDNGLGKLLWRDREFTKNLGCYTSLRHQGRWHPSGSAAVWKIERADDEGIVVRGDWLYLPLSQTWEIRLLEKGLIEWRVQTVSSQPLEIDCLQTNVMLSERYDRWAVDGESTALPEFKANIDDHWEVIYSDPNAGGNPKSPLILSSQVSGSEALPKVMLLSCDGLRNIVNSDLYHRGRLLQSLDRGPKILRPQEKLCHTSRIAVQDGDR